MLIIKNDWVIANITRGPLTFLYILAFIMRGDTNIDGNLSVIIIFEYFKYWQIFLPHLEATETWTSREL